MHSRCILIDILFFLPIMLKWGRWEVMFSVNVHYELRFLRFPHELLMQKIRSILKINVS